MSNHNAMIEFQDLQADAADPGTAGSELASTCHVARSASVSER